MSESHKQTLTIINKLGLHARAAAKFVTCASGFAAQIMMRRGEREVNGKSIMGVMMLAAAIGSEIEVEAVGEDALEAMLALEQLVADRFGEDE
ncbi:MAG: phosphocarrier protein HPr [Gammaproteobacteria bacterium]|jgi:phosphocarrier protein HPr